MRKVLGVLVMLHFVAVTAAILSDYQVTRGIWISMWLLTLLGVGAVVLKAPFLFPEGTKFDDYIHKRLKEETKEYSARIVTLEHAAITDPLTGVMNRRGGTEVMATHVARAKRKKSPVTVIYMDVDDFKSINDSYGHMVGDLVLARVAETVHHHLRASDVVARWGGEEFVLLLPDTDLEGAIIVANKLRLALAATLFSNRFQITASFGCALIEEDRFLEAVLLADQQLYLAKSQGKNTVRPRSEKILLDLTSDRT